MTDNCDTKEKAKYFAYHTSAAGLVLCAAQQSGLLEAVAELLCAKERFSEAGVDASGCLACELLQRLTDDFDEHIGVAELLWEEFFGEGVGIPLCSKVELEPYLSKPALSEIPA
jgi:hypothetical protein